ncbi:MAG: hypothetical protein R2698_01950 [Microthrixaceae bacterium]
MTTDQFFTRAAWPEGVAARISEYDTSEAAFAAYETNPIAMRVGDRVLHRFTRPASRSHERSWIEADGRGFVVSPAGTGSDLTAWTDGRWDDALGDLMGALHYRAGRFTAAPPFRASSTPDVTPEWWNARRLLWRVGDDRTMLSAFEADGLDVTSLPGRAVTVRGHAARLDDARVVWREDPTTVMVLGTSWKQVDPLVGADAAATAWGVGTLDENTIASAIRGLRP